MSLPIYRPIIPLTLAMAMGILLGETAPGHEMWIGLLICGTIAVVAHAMIRKRAIVFTPLLLACCLGYVSIQPWVMPHFSDHHVHHHIGSEPCRITGHVLNTPDYRHHRTRLVLAADSIFQDGDQKNARGRIRLTISGNPVDVKKGDQISFVGRLRSIKNFNNPGGFDYERYMAFQKIWVRSHAPAQHLTILTKNQPSGGWLDLSAFRSRTSELIHALATRNQHNGDAVNGISKALLIGDRTEVSVDLRKQFNRAGVGHLLAISGLHVGIVASVAFLLFHWIGSWIPPLLWNGWNRKLAAMMTFIPVLAYGFLAGMSPSTQRAVIMVGVFLLTLLLDQEQDLTNTICMAGLTILIIHPPALFSISFQLSFAAVLTIVWGVTLLRPLKAHQNRLMDRLIQKGVTFMAVSFFAILGTTPLVMAYFNQVSLIGIFVNIVAIPLVGFIVVPLGLLGVFLQLLEPHLAVVCLCISHWVLSKSIRVIQFFSDLPFAALDTITPSRIEMGLYYAMMLGVFLLLAQRSQQKTDRLHGSRTKRALAIGIVALAALGWMVDAGYWLHERFWHQDLRATILDVGQGSAALLELPRGRTVLIDGGGFSSNAVFDTGKNILAPYLLRKKIKTVDTLILSHPNSDHLNGLIYIAEHFKVAQAVTNGQSAATKGYRLFHAALKENDIDTPPYSTLDGIIYFKGGQLEILYPPRNFLDRGPLKNWQNANNNSLVVKVTMGQIAFLFPGDIMVMGEKALVASAKDNLKSTVLISPHHGSGSSSTPLFLRQVDPDIVIISCGHNNRFRFPSRMVLQRYQSLGCRVFRTDREGAVLMRTDGQALNITIQK